MSRKQNVTNEALAELVQRGDDLTMDIMNMSDEIRDGYIDSIDKPEDAARMMAQLASTAAKMSANILATAKRYAIEDSIAEMRKE